MATVEKSVILRVRSNNSDVNQVDDLGTDGSDIEKLSPELSRIMAAWKGPESTETWLILEPEEESGGFKVSPAFVGLNPPPIPGPNLSILSINPTPTSLIDGSTLYAINRCGFGLIDFENLSDGWRSQQGSGMDFDYTSQAAVFEDYIYMFNVMKGGRRYFACVVHKSSMKHYLIQSIPPEFQISSSADVWAPLDGKGMLFSFPQTQKVNGGCFHLHDPRTNLWECKHGYEQLPPGMSGPRCFLNGILYICDDSEDPRYYLIAYDCNKGKMLYELWIPPVCYSPWREVDDGFCPAALAAVSDSKFCLLSHTTIHLFCATLYVSSSGGGTPDLEVKGVQCFPSYFLYNIYSCLPMDARLGQIAKSYTALKKTRGVEEGMERNGSELDSNGSLGKGLLPSSSVHVSESRPSAEGSELEFLKPGFEYSGNQGLL